MNTEKTSVNWYSHGARYYDPQLARWHSSDPLAELYSGFSPYHYAGNNPVNFVDPNGMSYGPSDDERAKINEGGHSGGWSWNAARPQWNTSGADAYLSQGKWSYDYSSGMYVNSYSGAMLSATDCGSAAALAYMGVDFEYFDFGSFYGSLANDINGGDFNLSLEFGYGKLWFLGNSTNLGTTSSFGAVSSSNYGSYGEASVMASIGGRADGAHFFDMRGKKIGQLEVGTNWPLEAYVVKDKDIQGFNKAMRQRSRVDRWNSAMSYSQQAILLVDDFNSELVGRPVYTLKLKTDISYWANVFGEWGVKHYSPRSPQIEKAVEEAFGTFPRQIYEQGHWIEF